MPHDHIICRRGLVVCLFTRSSQLARHLSVSTAFKRSEQVVPACHSRTFVVRWAACLFIVLTGGSEVIAMLVPDQGFQAVASACSLQPCTSCVYYLSPGSGRLGSLTKKGISVQLESMHDEVGTDRKIAWCLVKHTWADGTQLRNWWGRICLQHPAWQQQSACHGSSREHVMHGPTSLRCSP